MYIIKHKKIFISISAVLVLLSIASLLTFGLQIGIDFKGGALVEVLYKTARPDLASLNEAVKSVGAGSIIIQPTGDLGLIAKSSDLNEQEHMALLKTLSRDGANPLEEKNFNSIGPSVGKELTRKAVVAVILVSLAIISFIAFAFRRVSRPIASWKYGVIAVIALVHDVTISAGIFSLLSYFYGAEVDVLFVVGILTILTLSVSDTIVIFDRIRENIKGKSDKDFSEMVGKSLDQSFVRSISTSMTVILVLLSLFFFGPESTKYFALMLTAGMFFGTYSSIFLASPLLVLANEWREKKTL